jgi:hypothetical protein
MPRKRHVSPSDILGDEWKTPNTYCNKFSEIGDFPAVYALVVYDKDCWFQDVIKFKIAYVGMSKRLSRRFKQHHALTIIEETGCYCQTWFMRAEPDELRDLERALIQKYDPPLNLIGKKVSLA